MYLEVFALFAIEKKRFGLGLTHCGRVRQICVFNALKLGTSASSP